MKIRRVYDHEFKIDAVILAIRGSNSFAQVAKYLGINTSLLYEWRSILKYDPQLVSFESGKPPLADNSKNTLINPVQSDYIQIQREYFSDLEMEDKTWVIEVLKTHWDNIHLPSCYYDSMNSVLNWWKSLHFVKIEFEHNVSFLRKCIKHFFISDIKNISSQDIIDIFAPSLELHEAALLYSILKSHSNKPNSPHIKLSEAIFGLRPKRKEYEYFEKICNCLPILGELEQVPYQEIISSIYTLFYAKEFDIAILLFGTVISAQNWSKVVKAEKRIKYKGKARNPLKLLLVSTIKEMESKYKSIDKDKSKESRIEIYIWPLFKGLLLDLNVNLFIKTKNSDEIPEDSNEIYEDSDEIPEDGIKKLLSRERRAYLDFRGKLDEDSFYNVFMSQFFET